MPFFDPNMFQQAWDQIFPAIRLPLADALAGVTDSVEAP